MWKCTQCGETVEDDFEVCWSCETEKSPTAERLLQPIPAILPKRARTVRTPATSEAAAPVTVRREETVQKKKTNPMVNRYQDLYRAARITTGIGNGVKVIGILVGVVMLLLALASSAAVAAVSQGSPIALLTGAIFAAVVGGIVFLGGVFISAQGQLLLAQADVAIYACPFMTESDKREVISLSQT